MAIITSGRISHFLGTREKRLPILSIPGFTRVAVLALRLLARSNLIVVKRRFVSRSRFRNR